MAVTPSRRIGARTSRSHRKRRPGGVNACSPRFSPPRNTPARLERIQAQETVVGSRLPRAGNRFLSWICCRAGGRWIALEFLPAVEKGICEALHRDQWPASRSSTSAILTEVPKLRCRLEEMAFKIAKGRCSRAAVLVAPLTPRAGLKCSGHRPRPSGKVRR